MNRDDNWSQRLAAWTAEYNGFHAQMQRDKAVGDDVCAMVAGLLVARLRSRNAIVNEAPYAFADVLAAFKVNTNAPAWCFASTAFMLGFAGHRLPAFMAESHANDYNAGVRTRAIADAMLEDES